MTCLTTYALAQGELVYQYMYVSRHRQANIKNDQIIQCTSIIIIMFGFVSVDNCGKSSHTIYKTISSLMGITYNWLYDWFHLYSHKNVSS